MKTYDNNPEKMNATIDIVKLLMAILVVGIHAEPFGYNIWLDRGFGIVTRLCVPFFFVASSYFFWIKPKKAKDYLKRILQLYLIWSIIYLPFDIASLKSMSLQDILYKYLWAGTDHALWFLCGTVTGFLIVFLLSKFLDAKKVFAISVIVLLIGCMKSTWSPMLEGLFSFEIHIHVAGHRNGLFYAFPYIALGRLIANKHTHEKERSIRSYVLGFLISMIMLSLESVLFVLIFDTASRILWISVLPCTYYFFMLVKHIEIPMLKEKSIFLRKMSILIYVSHSLFLILFNDLKYFKYFIVVLISSALASVIIITISNKKGFKWLKIFY